MITTKAPSRSWPALLFGATLVAAPALHAQEPGTPPTASFGAEAAPAPAAAETCGEAYERAQTEKVAGHYVTASAAALRCSQIDCSTAIVRECLRFYESLEEDTPTLVFSAHRGEGGDLDDVKVEIDGKPAIDKITGRTVAVDPGPHDFVFIHAARGRMQVSETARVGDHARVIEVTFPDPNAKAALPAAAPGAPAPPPPSARGVPVMTYVLGGVGVVALGSFILFRLEGVNDYNHQNATCSPRCNPTNVDPIRTKFLLSYVSLGLSAASFAGAGLVYFLAPGKNGGQEVQASISAQGDGALLGLKTSFE
jgi:hypothetical protein